MKATATIPKEITKQGKLVIIPKREYEEFTVWKKTVRVRLDEQWFWSPEWQKKEAEADLAIRYGRIYGPFSNHRDLIAALKQKRRD